MKKIVNIALAGIGAAMGIVVVVLGILDNSVTAQTYITLLGIGLFALGLKSLNDLPKAEN